MTDQKPKTGLELLRAPFPANQISKLPKPTKAQTDAVRSDFKNGARCEVCGGWHHPKVVHLDYVGHAALTDRLLDCDLKWNWEPVSIADDGTPKFDSDGGMWIKLTVCDVTRLGYGFADGKAGGNALKETIGDALRNAAMRFGAALDLWHKGELHTDNTAPEENGGDNGGDKGEDKDEDPFMATNPSDEDKKAASAIRMMGTISDMDEFKSYWKELVESQPSIARRNDVFAAKSERKAVIGGGKGAV